MFFQLSTISIMLLEENFKQGEHDNIILEDEGTYDEESVCMLLEK
jgi:hypothetical protein